ncbi:hypothetical protein COU77_00455 [Candidatus Peregrinibacteria bacterium CG10_big_fil_rev_8_21_14_0_10_49_16]|nr:MAG: hypothetical protein COW95_00470 [Candidatus Peregrinibacteria bacterium CG22_combo_CG10-13_8_21_14_all_49_11]PIR52416.1 MAG: hypothetical protein COU77_00455 [Candidatus Peregrinibacteria bacterium CG10_big_fil_rev_8_21_14_0_10_49_16]
MCILTLMGITTLLLRGSLLNDAKNASPVRHFAEQEVATSHNDLHLQADISSVHEGILRTALSIVPEHCVTSLNHLHVRYDNPKRRGLAGATTIILDGNQPDQEFRALFFHEFGHVADLGCIEGTDDHPMSIFKDGNMKMYANDASIAFYEISWEDEFTKTQGAHPEDFVSGYAQTDAFEDFAETFAYFILQQERFKERARENSALQKKYSWMRRHLFESSPQVAQGLSTERDGIPWDTTKLPYIWNPAILAQHKK